MSSSPSAAPKLRVSEAVLDASALLAVLQDERGAELVEAAAAGGALISAVNWAEVLSKLADAGEHLEPLSEDLVWSAVLRDVGVIPFGVEDAERVAELRSATRGLGLSLADRACLALAMRLELPALTTDRAWTELALP